MALTYNDKRFLENTAYRTLNGFLLGRDKFASLPSLESLSSLLKGIPAVCFEEGSLPVGVDFRELGRRAIILATDEMAGKLKREGGISHFQIMARSFGGRLAAAAPSRDFQGAYVFTTLNSAEIPHPFSHGAYGLCVTHPTFEGMEAFPSLRNRPWAPSDSPEAVALFLGLIPMSIPEALQGRALADGLHEKIGQPLAKNLVTPCPVDSGAVRSLSVKVEESVRYFSGTLERITNYYYEYGFMMERKGLETAFQGFLESLMEDVLSFRKNLPPFIDNILRAEDNNMAILGAERDPRLQMVPRLRQQCMELINWMEGHLHWMLCLREDFLSLK